MSQQSPNAGTVRWKDLRTGLLFFFGLIMIAWLGLYIGKNTGLLTKHRFVHVFVRDIKGLSEGNLVAIAGKKVGTVKQMTFTTQSDTNGVLLDLDIRDEFFSLISKDSKATIKSLGVLGDKYVDISIGHSNARLEDGGSLPLAVEPGIDDLTASAIKTMENVSSLTDKINHGEGTLGQLLTRTEVSDKINSTLANLNTLAARLTTGNGIAPQLLNNGELAQNISATLKNLNEASAQIKGGDGSLGKFLLGSEFVGHLNTVASHTDSLLAQMSNPKGTLGRLTRDEEVYNNINASILSFHESIKSLDSLLVDLKRNPGRYVTVKVF